MQQAIFLFSRGILAMTLVAALSACETAPLAEDPPEPGVLEATTEGPEGAPPGSCWGKTVGPAVIETVTDQIQVKPAEVSAAGNITALPVYRTETRQEIVTARVDNWFETPCTAVLDAEFNASLQRALFVRGIYKGPVNGTMDRATRAAVRRYQVTEGGPDSEVLSLEAARSLGLVAVERTPSE
jgi:hypothetical protein